MGPLKRRLDRRPLGHAALGAAESYARHATTQLAAAISFRVLFSLVPLVAFVAAISDLVLPDEQQTAVAKWLASVVPDARRHARPEHPAGALEAPAAAAATAGIVAMAILLWSASGMMGAIRIAFRVIWENDMHRTFVRNKLLDFALVLGVGIVAIAAIGATVLSEVVAQVGRGLSLWIGHGAEGKVAGVVAEVLGSWAVTFGIFLVLYRVVPPVAPRFRAVWLPALLAAIAFHLATAVYGFYLAHYGNTTAIYGPLGAVLGFLLVVYVGVVVVLLGAELVAAWPRALGARLRGRGAGAASTSAPASRPNASVGTIVRKR